jgi:uncharacterized protein
MGTVKREFRVMSAGELRAQPKEENKPPVIEGYAAVFDQASEDLGWFRETIKPGAFSRSLKEGADVRCLMNHNEDNVLGRTKSGTLEVSEDQKGLKFRCELPDTQTGRDLHQLVTRGDVDQCSFGFVVRTQNWLETKNADGSVDVMRELTDVDLFDVGPVTFPAYPQTSVNARALWPDGLPVEVRAHRREKRNYLCQCECPECEDGDCAECSNEECDDPNCEGERCRSRIHRVDAKKTARVDGEDVTSECFEACQQSARQIKISVDEIAQAIARAAEDPASAVSGCQNEFEEIARLAGDAIEECGKFSGDKPDESESERARARVRAIEATL